MPLKEDRLTGLEIAIIGMAARFPGARNLNEFWDNLQNGIEWIVFFSDEELEASGVPPGEITNPNYIRAKGIIGEVEYFDAYFFDYTPREAEMMDPQTRISHECIWEALENAGYDPYSYNGLIGLYMGVNPHYHWDALFSAQEFGKPSDFFTSFQFYDKDFLSMRISYKLNLRGPSFTLFTACSSSLVAIHQACTAILSGDCDMALAGGVSVWLPEKTGYLHEEGMILSADGHNRTFDEKATGSIFSDGVGLVAIKRLENALVDRDYIYAVIKGSALNNDGGRKLGFTAPSVEGLVEVINTALEISEVEPESISYFEAHGTATPLGDTVEIEALNRVFGTVKQKSCAIGSVKSNFGHLNSAAGVAGFIKTVLSLKHRLIPPSLHFSQLNSRIDLENSPFYVNTSLKEWKNDQYPLRAGVNSLGIGGTNAHVVLEEWAGDSESVGQGVNGQSTDGKSGSLCPPLKTRDYQLILLSAKTQSALDKMTENLAGYFKKNLLNHGNHENPTDPGPTLADAAYTLQVGRTAFQYRKMLVCSDSRELIDALSTPGSPKVKENLSKKDRRTVVFMFPGVGAQYVNMGREIYEKEPIFRKEMDHGFEILKPLVDYDIKEILYPHPDCKVGSPCPPHPLNSPLERGAPEGRGVSKPATYNLHLSPDINRPEIAQPIIFILEYALAKLLMHWGIIPDVMIGYSFGEYAAACIAGVFSLEDALKLVKIRTDLIRQTPKGAMLSVPVPVEELKSLLDQQDNVSIAIDNGPSVIVSGVEAAIDAFEKKMKTRKYICMRVDNTRALHAKEMEPILIPFARQVAAVTLSEPQIPYVSNVTGEIVDGNSVTHPGYWSKHLGGTVRFAEGIRTLASEPNGIFIEIGPGRDLSALVERYLNKDEHQDQKVIHLIPPVQKKVSEVYYLLNKLGWLWLYGITPGWTGFYSQEKRYRIPLPTYPFEAMCFSAAKRSRRTGTGSLFNSFQGSGRKDMTNWFYVPSWQRSGLPANTKATALTIPSSGPWLIFIDPVGVGARLQEELTKKGQEVITVTPGETFLKMNAHRYIINPSRGEDYHELLNQLQTREQIPGTIVHLWGITPIPNTTGESIRDRVSRAMDDGYHSLLFLAQAIGTRQISQNLHLEVITNNMQEVNGGEGLNPEKAITLGPCSVIPLEYPNIRCRSIDVVIGQLEHEPGEKIIHQLLTEFTTAPFDQIAAYRGNYRWVRTFSPHPLEKKVEKLPLLKQKGVYLVIGGLGGIGLILAEYLAKNLQARLILTGRLAFPPREQWEQYLTAAGGNHRDNSVGDKIRKLKELETHAAGLLILSADITNEEQMRQVFAKAEAQFGRINGVLHAAGLPDGKMIQLRTREDSERIMAAKINGTLVLDRILAGKKPDVFILCSSTSAVLAFVGQVSYCSANAFLDAYSLYKSITGDMVTISINWDRWQNVGFSTIVENQHRSLTGEELTGGITCREGVDAFVRILGQPVPQVIVSPYDLIEQAEQVKKSNGALFLESIDEKVVPGIRHRRPLLDTPYIAPVTQIEQIVSGIWAAFFGYEKIGVNDDFFDLGGDSLKAIAIVSKINKKFDTNVPISVLFNQLTVKGIGAYLESQKKSPTKTVELVVVEKKEYYPTTIGQKKLYVLSEMENINTTLNSYNIAEFAGKINRQRFQEAFNILIKRQESLRTSFHVINGEIVMKIHETDDVEFAIEYVQLQENENPGKELQTIIDNFSTPFDLSQPPLMRIKLVKLEEEKHMMLFDFHHITRDDYSSAIWLRELSNLYNRNKLPPLHIQYKDFAQWQQKFMKSAAFKKLENYWLEKFSGEVPLLNMPTDFPRPAIQDFEGEWISFILEPQVIEKIKQLGENTGITLYMILLAALNILLNKYTGQEDITIASPIIGRDREELENIMGLFINLLPMRNFPKPHKTFAHFLGEVRENALAAYENQAHPFGNLVEKLGIQKDYSRNPLNDIELIMIHTHVSMLEFEGVRFIPYEYDLKTTMVDMIIEVTEVEENISFKLMYCTKLFKRDTMERFINSFKEILTAAANDNNILLENILIDSQLVETKPAFKYNEGDFNF